eukprot:ctg_1091.g343
MPPRTPSLPIQCRSTACRLRKFVTTYASGSRRRTRAYPLYPSAARTPQRRPPTKSPRGTFRVVVVGGLRDGWARQAPATSKIGTDCTG